MRLQDTYKLDTSSVARGELNGVQYSTKLTSNDCFELGRQSYVNKVSNSVRLEFFVVFLISSGFLSHCALDDGSNAALPR